MGPAALIGPHGQSSWWVRFGGRACMCAAEHKRGVTPDEADCVGLDEIGQLHELLRVAREVPENYEDFISRPGPPPPEEGRTKPPREPEEPSRDDLDIGMDAAEPMAPLEGAGETASSTEVGEQSISWRGRRTTILLQARAEIPYGETGERAQFKRARLQKPLDNEQGKNCGGRNRTDRSRGRPHDEESRGAQLINCQFCLDTSVRPRNIISSTARGRCSLVPRSRTCSMGRG